MKKSFLFFALCMSILASTQAGYLIRGINTHGFSRNLENFTLTLNGENEPISAGTTNYNGANCIVIIQANDDIVSMFPIVIDDENYPIEVRDIHYIGNDMYILCGSYGGGTAFVAKIYGGFNFMDFVLHPEAEVYYSICIDTYQGPIAPPPQPRYFACGSKDNLGVISFINSSTLEPMSLFETDIPWIYHKIIAKRSIDNKLNVIASGRNLECDSVGFSVIDVQNGTSSSYTWQQTTEPNSHSVLCDYSSTENRIILASSSATTVTLNPISFPLPILSQISVYQFSFITIMGTVFCVQDVNMVIDDTVKQRVFVAGFTSAPTFVPTQPMAWFASISGFSNTSIMDNYFYYGTAFSRYEHYKIRFNQSNEVYTGGHCQSIISRGAMFGTPLTYAEDCYNKYKHPIDYIDNLSWTSFDLISITPSYHTFDFYSEFDYMYVKEECLPFPFKGDEFPVFSISASENESEVITFHDRITVKDIPLNTNYQIYSVSGQLIQTGSTNPDISTAQLSKGMYILRIENGKAFKFVK